MDAIEVIGLIFGSGVVSTVAGYLTAIKLNRAKVKTAEAEASELLSRTYASLIKDLNNEINGLRKRQSQLIHDIHELEAEVQSMRNQISRLSKRLKKYGEEV